VIYSIYAGAKRRVYWKQRSVLRNYEMSDLMDANSTQAVTLDRSAADGTVVANNLALSILNFIRTNALQVEYDGWSKGGHS